MSRGEMGATPGNAVEVLMHWTQDGVILSDAEGRIRNWNAGASRILGFNPQDVIGREETMFEFRQAPPESVPGGDASPIVLCRHRDGHQVRVNVATQQLRDGAGHPAGTATLFRQVVGPAAVRPSADERERALSEALRALRKSHEDLKSTQLQVIQAAKLESIGRLAAGVAHEVKNPLAVLLAGIQLLQLRMRNGDPANLGLLQDLEGSVNRANKVIMGLLDFAAATTLETEWANLDDIVREAADLVHHEICKRNLRMNYEPEAAIPPLNIDRTKIEQVLVNLMMNAIDAMSPGGTLTIRTSVCQLRQPGHGVGFRKSDVLRVGQTVATVEIEDTGTGIPDNQLLKVFEPFFTTKAVGKGTGLGLAVCRMIAGLHQGSVWLENRAEGGTRATLWLPAGRPGKGEQT